MPDKQQSFFQRFKKTIIGSLIFLLLMLAFANWLGFQHVPMHVRDLYNNITGLFQRDHSMDNFNDAQKAA